MNNNPGFLNFGEGDYGKIKNQGKQCLNFKSKNSLHIAPYYYCKLYENYLCYNCTKNLLENNTKIKFIN